MFRVQGLGFSACLYHDKAKLKTYRLPGMSVSLAALVNFFGIPSMNPYSNPCIPLKGDLTGTYCRSLNHKSRHAFGFLVARLTHTLIRT